MKRILFMTILLFGVLNAGKKVVFNDIIYLRSGEEIPCHVLEIKKGKVKFEKEGVKKPVILPVDSVASIDIGKIREGDTWKTIDDIEDPVLLNVLKKKADFVGNYVNLLLDYKINLHEDSTYSVKVRIIRKILTKSGESSGGNVRFWYPDFAVARLLFARSISPDGKITHIRDNAIEDASVNSSYPAYSHIKEMKLAIPESKIGNVLDFSFEIDYPKISKTNPFYFVLPLAEFQPTAESRITLKAPSRIKISFRGIDVPDPYLSNDGTTQTLTWKIVNHPGLKRERYMPPYKTLLPTVAFTITSTWEKLAERLNASINFANIPEELLSIKDPIKIFAYVQHNIEYVKAPLLSENFQFIRPKEVLKNGYANIFDKAILIYSALKKQGHSAKLGIILSKDNPQFPKLAGIGGTFDGYFLMAGEPGNAAFDGAFVIVDDSLYLFPGNRYTPPGYIPPEYQGAFYLNVTTKRVDVLPEIPAEGESFIVERRCRIDGNDLLVTETRTMKGYAEIKERELATLKPHEVWQKKEIELARIWQNAELLDFEHTDFDSITLPMKETLSYRVKGFLLKEGNLNLFRIPSFYTEDSLFSPNRTYPIYMAKPSYYKLTTYITLARGFKTLYTPKGTMVKDSGYYYMYSVYRRKNGYKIEEYMRRGISEIPEKAAMDYLKCIATPVEFSRKWFILKKRMK